jgi:REP element-mobilizing transposase RayT
MAFIPKQAALPFDARARAGNERMRQKMAGEKVHRGRGRPRKPGAVSHRERPGFGYGSVLHVTVKLRRGLPGLRGRKPFNAVAAAFRKFALSEGFRLVHFSVQHDHIHFLIEADSKPRLSKAMQKLCISIARRLNLLWGQGKTWIGRIFKQRYHAHLLKTPTEVRNAIVYVLANAAKHEQIQRGHADPFSSALAFDGYEHPPRVTAPPLFNDPKDLGTARTELLATRWRTRGLIDPKEAPQAA